MRIIVDIDDVTGAVTITPETQDPDVGSGELCSAMRNDDGTIRIWAGCETFGSTKECRARIKELGGEHEAERLAWLKWVKARLAVQP